MNGHNFSESDNTYSVNADTVFKLNGNEIFGSTFDIFTMLGAVEYVGSGDYTALGSLPTGFYYKNLIILAIRR